MIQIIIVDDASTVISEFNIESDQSGVTDPITLSDAVKDLLDMKFNVIDS